ncbi:DUF58 domain-containing protein [Sandaracinobacteroides hominis]|uniref:DUF58 domain-containing protein n=1 Tax=Sandaracinobacteroides hominis TaxID=2780086 RepID=UPI0018F73A22|nr:DUF58 domain-containing protein [Sandaracinobacteroides hominis]
MSISPTPKLILIVALASPLALLLAVRAPNAWAAILGLLLLLALLMLLDWAVSPKAGRLAVQAAAPRSIGVGETLDVRLSLGFPASAPASVEIALARDPLLQPLWQGPGTFDPAAGPATLPHATLRRGTAALDRLWCRWQGPLGLLQQTRTLDPGLRVRVLPDIRPVREQAPQLLAEAGAWGLMSRRQAGAGTEFEALADFRPGMDRRHIDWKQSARHHSLLAKEFRAETNNNLVLAIDCGRAMSDPLDGIPRVDHAISAALLAGNVALRQGDRAGIAAFDARPRVHLPPVGGLRAFPLLQEAAAGIDYSPAETNFTLGLSAIAAGLKRRSHLVVFTEFADSTGAALMLDAVGPLVRRHMLIFVVMRHAELEAIAAAPPETAEAVTRAATAGALLRERQLVIARLQRQGVHVLQADHAQVGAVLVRAWTRLARGRPA